MRHHTWVWAVLWLCAGSAWAAAPAPEVDLGTLAANPGAYRGQTVRTCGWARNAQEDTLISVARDAYGRHNEVRPGLDVTWPDGARETEVAKSAWRCIVGRIEPLCDTCISIGSPYRWTIVVEG